MLYEMYEEVLLPNAQKVTISKKDGTPFQLHLVSKPKYFLTLDEAEQYARHLKEEVRRKLLD